MYQHPNAQPAEQIQHIIMDAPVYIPDETTAEAATVPHKTLKAVSIEEFLSMEIAQKEMLLDPIIPTQGLAMLYAPRGVGKTYVALGIAYAVASGGHFLKWKAPKPRKVLIVDGEMPARSQQERLASLVKSNEIEVPPDHLQIITPDLQDSFIPDLSSTEGQAAIEWHLDGVELIILDNLSTLCRGGKENEGESWLPVQQWVLGLRRRGISVLFIHHAGKNNQQRGTSRREDILDTVISLQRPSDYSTEQGARFEVHYVKARNFFGDEAEPFEAALSMVNSKAVWSVNDIKDVKKVQVMELHGQGLKIREIAEELGISKSQVGRIIKDDKEGGAA